MNSYSKKQQPLRKDSLSQKVFYIVAALMKDAATGVIKIGDAYINFGIDGITRKFYQNFYGTDIFAKYFKNSKIKPEWEIKKVLKSLAQRKYIKISEERQKIYLDKKGISEFIKFRTIQKREKWDKKWRMVIFDVAEQRRNNRDFLRSRLKWLGFKELQKSVWIFPYDVEDDIKELMEISRYKCQGDIRFLTVEKIEKDGDLKKWFNLK
jgi:hypothetical protein